MTKNFYISKDNLVALLVCFGVGLCLFILCYPRTVKVFNYYTIQVDEGATLTNINGNVSDSAVAIAPNAKAENKIEKQDELS